MRRRTEGCGSSLAAVVPLLAGSYLLSARAVEWSDMLLVVIIIIIQLCKMFAHSNRSLVRTRWRLEQHCFWFFR